MGADPPPTPHRPATPVPPLRDALSGAWIVTRFLDVSAAIRDPRLVMPGTPVGIDDAASPVREAVARALSPERLGGWRRVLEEEGSRLIDALPRGRVVDLVQEYAEPWSLEAAILVTGLPRERARACRELARQVFLGAAHSRDGSPGPAALEAATLLAERMAGGSTERRSEPPVERPGGGRGHDPGIADVQSFVALACTLPGLLAGAWLLLLQKGGFTRLRADPRLLPGALDELLRVAGPSRIVFREARSDLELGGVRIGAGERLQLDLARANRDPETYPGAENLHLERPAPPHLALGAGPHRCAGAPLVRLCLEVATEPLVRRTDDLILADPRQHPVEWLDGAAIQAPRTLPVLVA